jgi:serine/threonine-protein kinase RsbW
MSADTETWYPPAELAAVPEIRHAVEKWLHGIGWPKPVIEDVTLIVTELFGNALTHGKPHIKITIGVIAGCVCGAVTDHGPGTPLLQPQQSESELRVRGRGLALVEALATEWYVEKLAGRPGKRVVFICCGEAA